MKAALTPHTNQAIKRILSQIRAGCATRLYERRIERSHHNFYKIEQSCWMPLDLAAEALFTLGRRSMAGHQGPPPDPLIPHYPETLRAITIGAPYAWMICQGYKLAEYRGWRTYHRGPILIHTSSSDRWDITMADYQIPAQEAPKGCIIGAATLTDCLPESDGWAHILQDPIFFTQPIPRISGQLYYWRPKTRPQIKGFNRAWDYLSSP